jgi:cell division topological specificity factor
LVEDIGHRNSADTAKERLKLVLIHDRTNLNARVLDEMKDELIEVISRHVTIDAAEVQLP